MKTSTTLTIATVGVMATATLLIMTSSDNNKQGNNFLANVALVNPDFNRFIS